MNEKARNIRKRLVNKAKPHIYYGPFKEYTCENRDFVAWGCTISEAYSEWKIIVKMKNS